MQMLIYAILFCAVHASEVRRDRRIVIDGFLDIRDIVKFIQDTSNGNFDDFNYITTGQDPGYYSPNKTQVKSEKTRQRVIVAYPKISLPSQMIPNNNYNTPSTPTETRRQDIETYNSTFGTSQTEISQEEIIKITQEIPVPYQVKIEKNVHYPVPVPYDQPVPIHVSQPYPIRIEKKIPVPVAVRVPQPIPIIKNIPVPVEVPVDNPVPYPVYKPVPIYIQKNVPYPVYKQIPMSVEVPGPVKKEITVPVTVEKKIPLFVPKPIPYEIKVPLPRTIRIEAPYNRLGSNYTISQASFAQMLKDAEFQSHKSFEFPVEFTRANGWTPVFAELRNNSRM